MKMTKIVLKRFFAISLALTLICTFAAGCGGGSASSGGGGGKILIALHDDTDTFLVKLVDAMETKAKADGVSYDIVYAGNSTDVQKQQIEQAAKGGYSAVICRLCDATTALQMEAAAGDLPIVFINNEPNIDVLKGDKYIYVGSYEQDDGRFQAEYIWNALGKPSKVDLILLKGEKGHSAVEPRTDAVKYYLWDNGVDVNIVFCDFATWSDTLAYERLDMFKLTGQNFDCIIANNDPMAVGAINWLKDNGYDTHKYLVAGIDATASGCEAVEAGDMYMTVLQDTAGQGNAAIESAKILGSGKSLSGVEGATDNLKYVWVPFVPVTKDNVAKYK